MEGMKVKLRVDPTVPPTSHNPEPILSNQLW